MAPMETVLSQGEKFAPSGDDPAREMIRTAYLAAYGEKP
jgi:hypothetical protein